MSAVFPFIILMYPLAIFAVSIYRRRYTKRINRALMRFDELRSLHGRPSDGTMGGRLSAGVTTAFQSASVVSAAWSVKQYAGLFAVSSSNPYKLMIDTSGRRFVYVHMRLLGRDSPHIYLDFLKNRIRFGQGIRQKLRHAGLVSFDGYISRRFRLYAPAGYALDSLVVAAPDVLDVIDRNHLGGDIEILGNQLYMIFGDSFAYDQQFEAVCQSAELIAAAVDNNLSRYRDQRATGQGRIAEPGRRLIRR